MTLQMFIHGILIDATEVDFSKCNTIKQKQLKAREAAAEMEMDHLNHSFISNIKPVFYLVAQSKANEIIEQDEDNEMLVAFERELKFTNR